MDRWVLRKMGMNHHTISKQDADSLPLVADVHSGDGDAALLLAAPTLLTMLERFYACTYGYDVPTLCQLDFQQAREAIAKAKGGA